MRISMQEIGRNLDGPQKGKKELRNVLPNVAQIGHCLW